LGLCELIKYPFWLILEGERHSPLPGISRRGEWHSPGFGFGS
jgi:hypothetical protein